MKPACPAARPGFSCVGRLCLCFVFLAPASLSALPRDRCVARADSLFWQCQFSDAIVGYDSCLAIDSTSVAALVGRAQAARYAGHERSECLSFLERALALDSTDAMANYVYGAAWLPWMSAHEPFPAEEERQRTLQAMRYLHQALAADGGIAHARTYLWVAYLSLNQPESAAAQVRALYDENYFPAPLLEFARNLLSGLPPNAILLTNGDNDTYPLTALQAALNFRTDVAVLNTSLLNTPWYLRYARDFLKVDFRMTDGEMNSLSPRVEKGEAAYVSDQVLARLWDLVAKGKIERPLYVAITCSERNRKVLAERLALEGLAYRCVPHPPLSGQNWRVLSTNVVQVYLVTPPANFDWPQCLSPVNRQSYPRVLANYIDIYLAAAQGWLERHDDARTRDYFWKAFRYAGRVDPARLGSVVQKWRRALPDDPDAREFEEKFPTEK